MLIELGAPASLPLSLVKIDREHGAKTALLSLTVQHPPIELLAEQDNKQLKIVGARAHIGRQHAKRFLRSYGLRQRAEVEIERSIPAFMGLGSDSLLGLAMAKGLAWVHDLPFDDTQALANALGLPAKHAAELWGFDQGGLLLVDTDAPEGQMPQIIERKEIEHHKNEAWAFVFLLPRVPKGTPDDYETEQMQQLLSVAPYLSSESGRIVMEETLPAVEKDDIAAFGKSLLKLHKLIYTAQSEAGTLKGLTPADYAILHLMRDSGAVAWGRSLTGGCLYGLVKGAKASIELRKVIRKAIGPFGGTVLATITDNRGSAHVIKKESLKDKRLSPYRLK